MFVHYKIIERICWLTFDREKALNALNVELLNEANKTFIELTKIQSTFSAVVIRGAGEKSFVAGADIEEMSKLSKSQTMRFIQSGHELMRRIENFPTPVVAAVHGFALGGGTELSLACDFIYASDKAIFGLPEVGLGLIPGFGGCLRLPRTVGFSKAKEMIFTGKKVNADEALRVGLVQDVLPHEGFFEKVAEKLKPLNGNSGNAIRSAKRLLSEYLDAESFQARVDAEMHAFVDLFGSEERKEGIEAFLQKRKPIFTKSFNT